MSGQDVLVYVLTAVLAVVVNSQQPLNTCQQRCAQFYLEFQQVNAQYDSCARGCDFYSRLDERTGDQPINTLQNCNDSCDERYEQEDNVPACQAGCGFSFDAASTGLNPPPAVRPQEKAQPLAQPLPIQRGIDGLQPTAAGRPSFISISLPNLLGQINRMMPQLGHMMRSQQQQHSDPMMMMDPNHHAMMDDEHAMEDEEEDMEDIGAFLRSNSAPGDSSSEEDLSLEEFPLMMSSAMSAPSLSSRGGLNSLFGRKDDDEDNLVDPFFGGLFSNINQQMSRMMQTFPRSESWPSWSPSGLMGEQQSGGKITVLRAGPGYHEEKEYDIGADGQITEVTTSPSLPVLMEHDALSHENPMEAHMVDDNDVEIFDSSKLAGNSIEELQQQKDNKEEELAISGKQDQNPFLSVLRSSVEESQRFGQELINRYNSQLRDGDYINDDTCQNHNVSWSDWVACVHARMGVPRWLTAATISLGIIFSVWLCLVIPSTAPKQRLRALIIRGKPSQLFSCQSKKMTVATVSDTAAAAKEAEANASAQPEQPTVAYIKVDLPPSYLDVTPGSPAPSYKSDMAAPRPESPTPSYKSVDIKEPPKGEKQKLEPVHSKKDSEA